MPDPTAVGRIVTDLGGIISEVDTALAAMLGYRPAEMLGRPTTDFVPAEGYEAVRAEAVALRDGRDRPMALARRMLRHRDGHDVPLVVTSSVVRDADGDPAGWLSMAVGVTDENEARAHLEAAHGDAVPGHVALVRAAAAAAAAVTTLDEFAAAVVPAVCDYFGWLAGALRRGDALVPATVRGPAERLRGAIGPDRPPGAVRAQVCPAAGGDLAVIDLCASPVRCALVFAGRGRVDPRSLEILDLLARQADVVVEREAAARRARDDEARFRSVFDASPLAMGLSYGDTGVYSEVNEALCELVGRSAAELVGAPASSIMHPDDVALADPAGATAAAAPDGRHRSEMRLLHASGRVVIAQVTLAWIGDDDGSRQLLAQVEDVTARRQAEQDLRWQADHDALTGLANRTHLTTALARFGRDHERCALLFVDVDGFKTINDVRGHDVGDEVLIAVGNRLRLAVRPRDLVARFGGDEFVVVVRDGSDQTRETLDRIADRVLAAMDVPVNTSAGELAVTVSLGLAVGRIDLRNPHQVLRRADAAMYRAKCSERDRKAWYDARLHRATLSRERVEARLRSALDGGRIELHYQPIVSLEHGGLHGVEALVRLRDERGRLHHPGEFIEVAEQSGLVVPLGTLVLREACATLARLRRETGAPLTVSVNVAAQQAARDDLTDVVTSALSESGLPPEALVLELTESSLLDAERSTLDQLVWLRRRGIGIALDDFGTGYSSLTYLRRFPVSCLKIDRTFVADLLASPAGHAIVRAVVTLATDLDLSWVAEGIETEEQAAVVRALGHGFGQGYLFGRPVPATELALPGRPGTPMRNSA